MKKIALCILTRNEAECLQETLSPLVEYLVPLRQKFEKIVVIDGNSTDGTVEMFQEKNIEVIAQEGKGRGAAFHTAFQQLEVDAWIFYSPDGNENIKDIPNFIDLLEKGADVVIASRMMKGAFNEEDIHLWRPRKWANNIFNCLANICFRKTGPYITDSINGYRAISKSAVKKLGLDAQDYTIEYQITMRALKHGMNIKEFPTHEGQRVAGDESPSMTLGIRFIKCLLREIRLKKV